MTTATSRMPAASYSRSPWNALWSMMIGFFMIMLDSTIVAIANPTIMAVLHVGYATVVWVTSAYLLGYAVVLLVAGRLGDRFGPKNLYLTGLAVFTAASMWCGLSGSAGALITARVVQGVGAGLLTAIAQERHPVHLPDRVIAEVSEIRRTEETLCARSGTTPTVAAMAEALGTSIKRVAELRLLT